MERFSAPIKYFMLSILIGQIASCSMLPNLDRFWLDLNTIRLLMQRGVDPSPMIGGEVRGLEGIGLRLVATVTAPGSTSAEMVEQGIFSNGRFLFPGSFVRDSTYEVRVLAQPVNPDQVCTVGGATGIVGNESDHSVLVQCVNSLVVSPSPPAIPEFLPPPGVYSTAVSLVLSSASPNVVLFYTLDGTDPNCEGSGSLYSGAIPIAQPTLPQITAKAIACDPVNILASPIQVGVYTVTHGQLAIPSTNLPPSGVAYTTAQTVTLTPPPGATVHYTIDGSVPTCSSPSAPNPITVSHALTIHAISCQADWSPSSVVSFYYNITGTVAMPSFSHTMGTYYNDFSLSLSSATAGASIRYTMSVGMDPPVPDCSGSTLYSGPILLNQNDTRVRAIGCLTDWVDSPATAISTYNFQVASPSFLPGAGALTVNTNVTGTTTTMGAVVHLADGSAPACGGLTSVALTISGTIAEVTKELYAIACRSGYLPSGIQMASYTMTGTISPVGFGTAGGNYVGSTTATILAGTVFPVGGFVRYTVDGSDPTCSTGTPYTMGDSIPINTSLTLKAIACKTSPAWNPSSVSSVTYNIIGQVASPTFSMDPANVYSDVVSVVVTSATSGSHIQYSLNTAITDCSQGTYLANGGSVNIGTTGTTLYAIGCQFGYADSVVAQGTYTLRPDTPVPSANPDIYQDTLTVSFTSSPGVNIYYTVDGTVPDCTPSGILGTSVTLNPHQGSVTLRAIACRTGFAPSLLMSGVYQMNGIVASPIWAFSNDATNTLTGTIQTPPIAGSQKICYREGMDPECSLTAGGTPNSLGGECAVGSTAYASPFTVSVSGSYRARSCAANYYQSAVQIENVTISGTVGAVSISPAHGTVVNNDPTVTISATGATAIYYRTDGTNPDCSGTGSTMYNGLFLQPPVSLGSAQISVIACASGMNPAVSSASYVYNTAPPAFSLLGQNYTTTQTLSITSSTTDASIFYRVDGTPATCGASANNFAYSGSIVLPAHANFSGLDGVIDKLSAIVCKTNYNPSVVNGPVYNFNVVPFSVAIGEAIVMDVADMNVNFTMAPSTWKLSNANPAGTVFCYRPDGTDPDCSNTNGGNASISGDFCATGSLPASSNFITANASGNYRMRGCRLGFKYTPVKTIELTIQEFRPRIFVSNAFSNGNTSVEAADAICNSDTNRPFQKPEATYKAMRLGGGRTLTSNWVLEGNTEYYNLSNQLVGSTPADGAGLNTYDPFSLTNPISYTNSYIVFTGMMLTETPPRFAASTFNCNNWTSVLGSDSFASGSATVTDGNAINSGSLACHGNQPIYCVEQHPRKRIFVTAWTYSGSLGGKLGADAKCNDSTEANKPRTGVYKALIRTTDRTWPSTDWVMLPNTTYYRPDRTTVIGTTSASGTLSLGFSNPIWTSADTAHAGYSTDWTAANNCSDYTSDLVQNSLIAVNTNTYASFWQTTSCNFHARLICVEQ